MACRSGMSKILKIFFLKWPWDLRGVDCNDSVLSSQADRSIMQTLDQARSKKSVQKIFLKWPWEVWTALNSPACEWRHGRLGLDADTRPWPGQGYTNTKTGWAEIQVSTNTNTNTDSRICKALTWPRLCKYKHRNQKSEIQISTNKKTNNKK